MKILDYSWARPSPRAIVDLGYVGVMRYLGPGTGGRDLTRAECEKLWAVGLGVGFAWETSASRALQGFDAGRYDAERADHYAGLLEAPSSVPIYFACDCDVSHAQTMGPVRDYFAGVLGCPYPGRSYGEAGVLDMCADSFGMRHGWQPAARSWSDGRVSAHASMLQRWPYVMNDMADRNDVLCPNDQVDWLWGGSNMALSTEDLAKIKQIVNDCVNTTLTNMYTGSRPLQVAGHAEIYELVHHDGQLCRRYIGTQDEIGMLQYVDHLAGPKGAPPRQITEPADIAAFECLPVVQTA